jgi:hypothetical protein
MNAKHRVSNDELEQKRVTKVNKRVSREDSFDRSRRLTDSLIGKRKIAPTLF